MKKLILFVLALGAAMAVAGYRVAADAGPWRAVLISGGDSPAANAVAHEKNLLFVSATLVRLGLADESIAPFVSVGDEPLPDTSYLGPPLADRWELVVLDRLFGRGGIDLEYRHHQVPGVAGPARREAIVTAVAERSRRMRAGDTLLIYGTDHGRLNPADSSDNLLVLWGGDTLSVSELRQALDAGREGRVVAVMAQCYSGAFGNLMWSAEASVPAAQDRCGFFATDATREAAGCTPELDEATYDDYSTRFFAALGGQDRQGAPVAGTDHDGDGHVSFAEAHAYAIAHEETIDVPLKTSEMYLEQMGIASEGPWEPALAAARLADKAALETILRRLSAEPGDPRSAIAENLARLRGAMHDADDQIGRLDGELAGFESKLRHALLERWPVLDTPYHPDFPAALAQGAAVRNFLAASPTFQSWDGKLTDFTSLQDALHGLQIEEAWWLRAKRLTDHLVRRNAKLPPQSTAALSRLEACEASVPGL